MSRLLDDRARHAAAAIHEAVREIDLRADRIPGAPPVRHRIGAPVWSAAAGVALGAVVIGAWLLRPTEVLAPADTTLQTPTVVTTAAPEPTVPTTALATTTPQTTPATTPAPPTTVDTLAPPIVITFPENGYQSAEKTITFTGTTEPGAVVTAGAYTADVAPDGTWSIRLIVSEGETTARFVATDAAGNSSSASVTVGYQPPTTTKPEPAPFTAHNTYGSCSTSPPYDVYYGTGQPGSTVSVTSEFGSRSTTVGPDGNWEVEVVFETAIPGKTFAVTAKDQYGRKQVFEFTSTVG